MLCAVQGSWEAAENILNTIVLPPAIDDAGGAGSMNYDWTQVRPMSHPSELIRCCVPGRLMLSRHLVLLMACCRMLDDSRGRCVLIVKILHRLKCKVLWTMPLVQPPFTSEHVTCCSCSLAMPAKGTMSLKLTGMTGFICGVGERAQGSHEWNILLPISRLSTGVLSATGDLTWHALEADTRRVQFLNKDSTF